MTHYKGKHRNIEGKELFSRAANRHLLLPNQESGRWNRRELMVTAIEESLTNKLIGEDPTRVLPLVYLVGDNVPEVVPVVSQVKRFLTSMGYPIDDSIYSFNEFSTWNDRQEARHLALLFLSKYSEKNYIRFEYEIPSKSRFLRHDGRTGWNL